VLEPRQSACPHHDQVGLALHRLVDDRHRGGLVDGDALALDAAFADLGLSEVVLDALAEVGYESPSPIQAATIPVLLAGHDMLGQAQTGTGKTAAFALPMLSRLEVRRGPPQGLVLVPTRELAIQVAEAFQRYASKIKGFHVLPIYGGQSYTPQLMSLKRGAHVVVGTPGRVMDHLKRGTLDLGGLTCLTPKLDCRSSGRPDTRVRIFTGGVGRVRAGPAEHLPLCAPRPARFRTE